MKQSMTTTELEHRLATIERKLSRLVGNADAAPSQDFNAWIDEIHGTFQDNATYRQGARLGRQWRKLQRASAK
jgi:hypothetical protein